jgi:competence protein ComEC
MIDYLQRAPFIRILLPFVCGVIFETYICFQSDLLFLTILVAVLLALILFVNRASFFRDIITGVLFTLFFFTSGIVLTSVSNRLPSYPGGPPYKVTLLEKPVEKDKSFRAECMITACISGDSVVLCHERIIVYFGKNSKADSLKPGSRIVFNQVPRNIENQGNPFEFDYVKYTALRNIRRQVYLKEKSWVTAGHNQDKGITILAERVRDYLLGIYQRNGLQGIEFEILSALTLGYKKSMDPEIKQVFAATGASHVLAVSGLHVGIVYLVFNLLFGFMRKGRYTRVLFVLLAISFLWVFAFITGLSPSVQRSALMFTIVLAGENLRRPANIYNTLTASFFILTVINPAIIFDVGFQLSYAAVFGIVYFQPRLSSLFTSKVKPVSYLWGLFTVSLAAQITTFPLSCFYFNQFPVYFWLSNFIVIPLAFLFIFLGILILATSQWTFISGLLAKMAILLVKLLYHSLQWIESLPGALLKGFNFPFGILVITTMLIILIMLFMETRKLFYLKGSIMLLIVAFFFSSGMKVLQNHQKEIIAYKTNEPVVHLVYGRTNYLLAPGSFLKMAFPRWQVLPVIKRLRLKDPLMIPFEDDYRDSVLVKIGPVLFFDGTVICLQSTEYQNYRLIKPDIVLTKHMADLPGNLQGEPTIISYDVNLYGTDYLPNVYRVNETGAWRFHSCLLR